MSHSEPAQATAGSPLRRLSDAAIVAFALFHLHTSLFGNFEPLIQRSLFIGGGIGLIFLDSAGRRWAHSPLGALADALLGLAAITGGAHVAMSSERLMDIMSDLTPLDMTMGVVMIFVALEAARRTVGLALPVMAISSLAYYLWGNTFITGNWQPPWISVGTALSTLYGSTGGMFGMLADIGTRVVAVYVVFGSLLMAVGAGEVFMRAATMVAGRTFGGPAKVAVVTSALFGTISGSAVANVMSVGSITIPTMLRAGYRKDFAAGVEASASAGGQIMPPVMGAGAFIMAELLNISYPSIALAAAVPALLYFSAIYFSIDCYARANGMYPISREEIPRARDVLMSLAGLTAFGPLVLLAWMLFAGYTPTMAGGVAALALGVFAVLVRVIGCLKAGRSRDLGPEVKDLAGKVWGGLVDGGKGVVVIAALLAAASLLVTVLTATGVSVKFSQLLLGLSGENLVGTLLISALLCILLGMDVPTTASYLLTAAVAAPALGQLGLPPLTAHLFIFYYAILSAITPPVCASVYAAATIAHENFWKVASQALRIAGAVYLIPFMIVYRPELMLNGWLPVIGYQIAVCWVAVVAMSGAAIGYLLRPLGWLARCYLLAAAAALFFPTLYADLAGIALIAAFLAWQWQHRSRGTAATQAHPP